MQWIDKPLEELQHYTGSATEPPDFDEFWQRTLREHPFDPASVVAERVRTPLTTVDVWDVTFGGFANDPIRAWLLTPAGASGPLPTIIQFNGYGGGRGLPVDHLEWASAGYAHLFMDTRGQGAGWGSGGDTLDPHGTGPAFNGVMTKGIDSADTYYYRRCYVDAHHAVEAATHLPCVDSARLIVHGISQGGGLAIAAAALNPRVWAAMPDVPFLCDFPRAVGLTGALPYDEITQYLKVYRSRAARVFTVLSYFDGVNLARRARVPALFSTALMDEICPPSSVFAAYNRWGQTSGQAVERDIRVYTFNGHEGGERYQWQAQTEWLAGLLSDGTSSV